MKTKIAIVNGLRFVVRCTHGSRIIRPFSKRKRKRTRVTVFHYRITGPKRFVRRYESTKDAWMDVVCAHLDIAGQAEVIDRVTTNWPADKIVLQ